MCGVFEFRTRMVKDTKMGYVEVHTQPTCRLFPPNQTARGQVYHFFQVRHAPSVANSLLAVPYANFQTTKMIHKV